MINAKTMPMPNRDTVYQRIQCKQYLDHSGKCPIYTVFITEEKLDKHVLLKNHTVTLKKTKQALKEKRTGFSGI